MVKRAVIVGINDYTGQWADGSANLTWCVNDAQSVYHLLVDAFGFDTSQIYLYTNGQASRSNILRALRCITSTGEPGDVACFYYSGHGARVPASGGHGDADAYYETIIPASGNWISDWEIAEIANDLQPSYVNFTCILDSCHSGGMHPADSALKVRCPVFTDTLLQSLTAVATATLIPFGLGLGAQLAMQLLRHNVSNIRRSSTASCGAIDLDPDPDKTLIAQSKSTLLAGCHFNQLSWEAASLHHGLMTKALLDVVNTCPFEISYTNLLDELRTRVGAYITQYILPGNPGVAQNPQLFGQANRMGENFLAGFTTSQ